MHRKAEDARRRAGSRLTARVVKELIQECTHLRGRPARGFCKNSRGRGARPGAHERTDSRAWHEPDKNSPKKKKKSSSKSASGSSTRGARPRAHLRAQSRARRGTPRAHLARGVCLRAGQELSWRRGAHSRARRRAHSRAQHEHDQNSPEKRSSSKSTTKISKRGTTKSS